VFVPQNRSHVPHGRPPHWGFLRRLRPPPRAWGDAERLENLSCASSIWFGSLQKGKFK